MTYEVLRDLAPQLKAYLGPLTPVADVPGRQALRSASSDYLVVPTVNSSAVVPCRPIWNNLVWQRFFYRITVSASYL